MIQKIDQILDSVTMYKVVLYGLIFLVIYSFLVSAFGGVSFSVLSLFLSLILVVISCWISNIVISHLFHAPTNHESWAITALILFFLLSPVVTISDGVTILIASILAMVSKYIVAIGKKHLFNPAAFAAVILGILGNRNVIWWIGSSVFLPVSIIVGFCIVRKIRRFSLVYSFLAGSLGMILIVGLSNDLAISLSLKEAFVSWPLIFFGTIMLTEPLTTPPKKNLQILYGMLVGLLFGSQFSFGRIYNTPELALILGNIYSYLVSPKHKLLLQLKNKLMIGLYTHEFSFGLQKKIDFSPGQYMEWTLPHTRPDMRGNRRYFTIASSPTETDIKLGVRIHPQQASSFKRALLSLNNEKTVIASHLVGDFILPKDKQTKLAFIAGGIGVTPFRSMIKYLLDMNERRDIVMVFANKLESEIIYRDLFDEAERLLNIKIVYTLTETSSVPKNWNGKTGRFDHKLIAEVIPDFESRLFYLSGPHSMVTAYEEVLKTIGVPRKHIKKDYFPGFA